MRDIDSYPVYALSQKRQETINILYADKFRLSDITLHLGADFLAFMLELLKPYQYMTIKNLKRADTQASYNTSNLNREHKDLRVLCQCK